LDKGELDELTETPAFHGYAPPGDPIDAFRAPLTIAISRETGARGRAIAKRTADILGWELIDQETLEHSTQTADCYAGIERSLGPRERQWVERNWEEAAGQGTWATNRDFAPLVRVVFEIAARGQCVILGRGAGCILPAESKLYVRLIAPEHDRVAYLAQVERLSYREAERVVRQRDEARQKFIQGMFGRAPTDVTLYDLVLNVARLGIQTSAAVIVAAAREKMQQHKCR
jgi:hypothetical protein